MATNFSSKSIFFQIIEYLDLSLCCLSIERTMIFQVNKHLGLKLV